MITKKRYLKIRLSSVIKFKWLQEWLFCSLRLIPKEPHFPNLVREMWKTLLSVILTGLVPERGGVNEWRRKEDTVGQKTANVAGDKLQPAGFPM